MTAPFIILALPRSRTFWLSRYLGNTGHDIATECSSIQEFKDALATYDGTCETGAVVGWRSIFRQIPSVRVLLVRRPVEEAYNSLAAFGLASELLMAELKARDALLDQVARIPGVRWVSFDQLATMEGCQRVWEFCRPDKEFDWQRWEDYADRNLQVDMPTRLKRLTENYEAIEALKREAAEDAKNPLVTVGVEPWDAIWPDCNVLGAEHFEEVDGGIEPNRPFKLDEPVMRAMSDSGQMIVLAARVDGVLAGYFTWQLSNDVESQGLFIAQQGAWFVRPGYASLRLGAKLFDKSVEELRKRGVKNIFPHHRLQGRGARLGAFFARRGAVEIQHTYSLWIGG